MEGPFRKERQKNKKGHLRRKKKKRHMKGTSENVKKGRKCKRSREKGMRKGSPEQERR